MVDLQADQRKLLRKTIVSCYSNQNSLDLFVYENFNGDYLSRIGNFQGIDFTARQLIGAFEEDGKIPELILALAKEKGETPQVQKLIHEFRDSFRILGLDLNDIFEARGIKNKVSVGEEFNLSESDSWGEPDNTAHLVIAVFKKKDVASRASRVSNQIKVDSQQFRVDSKLYYEGQSDRAKILLVAEDLERPDILQRNLPNLLRDLKDHSLHLLGRRKDKRPWHLIVDLFVPLELLCLPMSAWYVADIGLRSVYPLVLGCSDRYLDSKKAREMYNRLLIGWENFRKTVPDTPGSTLRELQWLGSGDEEALHAGFLSCAGFRCNGDWLISGTWKDLDKTSQTRWKQLVECGIPLALWFCEGDVEDFQRIKVFDSLTRGSRFEMLQKLPEVRESYRKKYKSDIGVFYENVDYLPLRPTVEPSPYFSFPAYD
jgi:hypothetical protein